MSGETHDEPPGQPDEPQPGSPHELRESNLSARTEARLANQVAKAVAAEEKKGRYWWGSDRWPLDIPAEQLKEKAKERPLTLREKVALGVHGDVEDKDKRVRRIATRTVLAMDKLNQADEHKVKDDDKETAGPVQLVRVVVGDRQDVANFESLKMKQLGEMIEQNEPEPIDEEIEDVD